MLDAIHATRIDLEQWDARWWFLYRMQLQTSLCSPSATLWHLYLPAHYLAPSSQTKTTGVIAALARIWLRCKGNTMAESDCQIVRPVWQGLALLSFAVFNKWTHTNNWSISTWPCTATPMVLLFQRWWVTAISLLRVQGKGCAMHLHCQDHAVSLIIWNPFVQNQQECNGECGLCSDEKRLQIFTVS